MRHRETRRRPSGSPGLLARRAGVATLKRSELLAASARVRSMANILPGSGPVCDRQRELPRNSGWAGAGSALQWGPPARPLPYELRDRVEKVKAALRYLASTAG